MTIGEILREEQVEPGHDSRSIPLFTPDGDLVATTGDPTNDSYGLADLEEVKIAGHWVLVAHGTDGSTAWWDEADGKWQDGRPD